MIEMKVAGIGLDPGTRSSVLLLKDSNGRRALPIYIGPEQANAIGSVLENKVPPRPSTHDIFTNLLDAWALCLDKVIIHTLKDNTFYASLVVLQGEQQREIDARPSDAIALAVRANCAIWVVEEVVANASIPVDRDADEAEQRAFREFVAGLNPKDLVEQAQSKGHQDFA
ncbi:bifunctional nuclease family protein [filamentous cyanobacterium LEGE 11480]|uniref:Bifunctional nuclease family protein n=1 Tax=Romeriopsis navalis LEGE 11480 TaxID=2777977 RepID=A0A928VM18_9CYAN|nr:bifunctional nuclease family protein [Romeriopsis navalis]MBE9028484.1 bifunctional nuclease family protein [Romeriopsis navalis LEGE 11480]